MSLTTATVAKQLGVPEATVGLWDDYCPYIEEGLNPVPRNSIATGGMTKTYSPNSIATLEEIREGVRKGSWTNRKMVDLNGEEIPPGKTWVSLESLAQPLRLIWRNTIEQTLRALRIRIRSGKLRAKKFGFLEPHGNCYWCLKEDAELIILSARAERAKRRSNRRKTKGCKINKKRSPLLPRPMSEFDGIFNENPRRFTFQRARIELNQRLKKAKLSKVGSTLLYKYAENVPEIFRGLFPSDKFPTEDRLLPGSPSEKQIPTISESDIDVLFQAIVANGNIPKRIPGLLSNDKIYEVYVVPPWERGLVNRLLKDLPGRRLVMRPKAKVGFRTSARNDPEELARFLGGRNISEVAREHVFQQSLNGNLGNLGKVVFTAVNNEWAKAEQIRRRPELKKRNGKPWCSRKMLFKVLADLARAGLVERNPLVSENGKPVLWRKVSNAPKAAPAITGGSTSPPPNKPRWDGETRTLWLGDQKLKTFGRNPARNQIDVIEAFENANWDQSVASPFPKKETLKQACKWLNTTLPTGTIRFGGDGTGEGIRWRFAETHKN